MCSTNNCASTDALDRYPNLLTEMDAIREAISNGILVLGICLGAQLIAEALGARVGRNPAPVMLKMFRRAIPS